MYRTPEETEEIIKTRLNRRQEGITDFVLHRIVINDYENDMIIAEVGYTWYLNGHPKPVKLIELCFLKLDGEWINL